MYALIATWKSVTFLGNSLTDIDARPVNLDFNLSLTNFVKKLIKIFK